MTRALIPVGDLLFKKGHALLPVALINLRRADHPGYTAEAFVSYITLLYRLRRRAQPHSAPRTTGEGS